MARAKKLGGKLFAGKTFYVTPKIPVDSKLLKNVVIDHGVVIPEGLVVGEDPVLDAKRFRRTDSGICLITQPMIDKLDL